MGCPCAAGTPIGFSRSGGVDPLLRGATAWMHDTLRFVK
jgi:hypothetical protein